MAVLVVVLTRSSAVSHTETAANPSWEQESLGSEGMGTERGEQHRKTEIWANINRKRKAWACGKGNRKKIQLKN